MKTLVVFSMAFVASQAFFLPHDFFTDIAHRMTDLHHAVRPQGQFSHHPKPPLVPLPEATNDPTHQRMKELFDGLTPEEQAAMKNHLFGERFPRPLPAAHSGKHHKFTDEQIEAARAKWNSMTPEQQQAFRAKHERHHKEIESAEIEDKVRLPRSVKPAHHQTQHHELSDEKLQEIRARWEAMTPEEREAIKNSRRKVHHADKFVLTRPEPAMVRSPRSFQAIQPLPDFQSNNPPLIRNPRPFQSIQPLPDFQSNNPPLIRSPRSFQAIQPLPEFISNNPPLVRSPRSFQTIQPLPEFESNNPPLVRSPRSVQSEQPSGGFASQGPLNPGDHRRPLEGPANPGDHRRPNYPQKPQAPGGNQRPNYPKNPSPRPLMGKIDGFMPLNILPFSAQINPQPDFTAMLEKMKGMTEEEQIKYIRELFPEGLPIRPLSQNMVDPGYTRPVQPFEPAAAQEQVGVQPIQPYIFPIAVREPQLIFPIPEMKDPDEVNWIGPIPIRKPEESETEEESSEETKSESSEED